MTRVITSLLLALTVVDACDYTGAAKDMFGANCSALMLSAQAGFCTSGHPQSPFIGYVCGTSCGIAASLKSQYPNAYTGKDVDVLFNKVLYNNGGGLFLPDASYQAYNNYGDMDPSTPKKQIFHNCSDMPALAAWAGAPLTFYCTPTFSVVCPETYDAKCVPDTVTAPKVVAEPGTCLPDPTAAPTAAPTDAPKTDDKTDTTDDAAAPAEEFAVSFTLKASGDVADYTPAVKDAMATKVASSAGVDKSKVVVEVTAGSVNIKFTVKAATAAAATAAGALVQTSVASASAATAFFSTVPGITITVASVTAVSAPVSTATSGLSGGALAGIIIGAVVGVLAIGAIVYFAMKGGGSSTKSTA